MSSPHVLAATIRHRLGPLSLDVRFSLTAPWTVLFGPSAAGKSTLLRILAGLVKADLAEITGRGKSVGGSILVMQDPALFPHLSVERNIAFGLHALDKAARRRRLKAMLALFDLEPLAARMPRSLSGGEQQRVALARALAPAPSLLLLDEPFNALDGALKTALLGTITRALAEEHSAVFYVSHDVAEVFELKADVLLLEAGRIVGQGPPEIVLREHRERLLRQLRA